MTISSTARSLTYTAATGRTDFATTFTFLDAADLFVIVDGN